MMSRTLSQFHLPWLTCIGLALFFTVFLGALLWVYRRGSAQVYESASRIPLDAESPWTKEGNL